ncbi:MAG: YihY/virulence factor BrkB family protein [Leptolyngbya sp. SIO4C1]|nr:YihY/virulence factor BrkB family protein [Leptolyngbya sp. SIO4C1]
MGAALAYYALFSLFPIILVILSVVGFLTGPTTHAYDQILVFAKDALPQTAYQLVDDTLLRLYQGRTSASIVGFVILLFTASTFFNALRRAFNRIWQAHPVDQQDQNWLAVVLQFLWNRLIASILVISSTGLIVLSLLSKIAIDVLLAVLDNVNNVGAFITIDRVAVLPVLQLGASWLILTGVVMMLFKFLPSTKVAWKDVWLGAMLTATTLVLLQQLISNSVISLGNRFQSYGIVGSVMVLLLWIYLTSQIFFIGCEFTYVYAHLFGSRRLSRSHPPKLYP